MNAYASVNRMTAEQRQKMKFDDLLGNKQGFSVEQWAAIAEAQNIKLDAYKATQKNNAAPGNQQPEKEKKEKEKKEKHAHFGGQDPVALTPEELAKKKNQGCWRQFWDAKASKWICPLGDVCPYAHEGFCHEFANNGFCSKQQFGVCKFAHAIKGAKGGKDADGSKGGKGKSKGSGGKGKGKSKGAQGKGKGKNAMLTQHFPYTWHTTYWPQVSGKNQ